MVNWKIVKANIIPTRMRDEHKYDELRAAIAALSPGEALELVGEEGDPKLVSIGAAIRDKLPEDIKTIQRRGKIYVVRKG